MGNDIVTAFGRTYEAGTILFEEKDPGSRMYVIHAGKVKIFRRSGDRQVVLAFLGPGEFFGEMALLEGLPRSASAETVEESTLVEVDANTFEDMLKRNAEVAVRIMRKLSGRVRELDRRVERLLVDNAVGRTVEVLRWLLPHGLVEGQWIRITGEAAHLDITAQAGVPAEQAERIMQRLEIAGCCRREGDELYIAHSDVLDSYASFLSLKRRYEPIHHEEIGTLHKPAPKQAMHRLLRALSLDEKTLEQKREKLLTDYERYISLRERFADKDNGHG